MNPSKIAPVVIALLCIAAIGVSATTLESSLSTDPDEEIDLSYERLPIGEDDAVALQEEMEGSEERETVEVASAADSEEEASGRRAASSSSESEVSSASSREETTGSSSTPPSLLDRLLALLRLLAGLAVVLAAAALAIRYRERILAALSALFESEADVDETGEEAAADPWPDADPSNAVDRAWVALVREVDPERPAVMTPSECAAAAREAGLDAATVETITGAFERVNYGGADVSAERDRAAEALERLPARVRDAGTVDPNHAPSNGGPRRGAGGDR